MSISCCAFGGERINILYDMKGKRVIITQFYLLEMLVYFISICKKIEILSCKINMSFLLLKMEELNKSSIPQFRREGGNYIERENVMIPDNEIRVCRRWKLLSCSNF